MRARASGLFLIVLSLGAQNLMPPPWVRQAGVVNAAGQLPVNLPGGGLAPGALIRIDGLRFVPPATTVEIEAGGRSLAATLLRLTPEQILARLPDFSYSGPAKLFVISRGQRSVGTPVILTRAAFGIFTADRKPWGLAAWMESPEGSPAALALVRPGSRITISGTGAGHAAASEIEVFVADRKAAGVRRGGRNGLDQVSFEVPAQTPSGCAVPLAVRIGSSVSNSTLLSVGGKAGCDPAPNWHARLRAPGRRTGAVILMRSDVILELTPGKPVPFIVDNAFAAFSSRPPSLVPGPFDFVPPPGVCLAYAGSIDSNDLVLPAFTGQAETDLDLGPAVTREASVLEDLDAGTEITIEGPVGTRRVMRSTRKPHVYSDILGGNPPVNRIPATPLFLGPGDYRIDLSGGKDLARAHAGLAAASSIEWRNRDAVTVLDRRAGADVEWAVPEGFTPVVFAWNIDRRNSFGGLTFCRPASGATRFHIPATAIANLPGSPIGGSDLSLGFLGLAAVPVDPPAIAARGLDEARAIFASLSGRTVTVR